MENSLPRRMQGIKPFLVMDILERARQLEVVGREVIHLEVGEPDFETPEVIVRAGQKALADGHTHYTTALGIPELREAIAERYNHLYGLSISSSRVVVTSGTSPAMLMLFSILIEEGDEVILSNPHYACHPSFILSAMGAPVLVPAGAEEDFVLQPDAVRERITPQTKCILINSPSNPMGTRLDGEEIEALAALGPPLVSDEIYHGLNYGERDRSALEYSDEAFVINGFSKYFAMTGWRLGYLIVPERYVRPFEILQQNYFVSPNPFVQWAGVAALREGVPAAEEMRRIYAERRKTMIRGLKKIGLPVHREPDGAFYAFADAHPFGENSLKLAREILEATGVAVAPGADFGPGGEGYLRFAYCNSVENIELALDRVGCYLASR
ncbi:MAG: pyridoxal phosphate-dependent aminotransferase [Nitrospinota bacterium]|nr:pyridoxal phosphate-dependent aminotransferase [Nitrospinota bacterium]MDP7168939.1 pyridoxal phosphate-dependent aminotransferase [Nitrospinota bacterium]MDP7370801.1 pyridoxal phosphate-dependent aminotransferase [Nitrospinota bacterium]MDP7665050.1 pyridoxal phosphate-dependent aminotransferase [Nitrospinota bacterium]